MNKALSAALSVTLLATLAACSKEPPPKPDDGPKKATPVPSDMVFNDFVPPTGNAGIVGVKTDGGLEAGADLGTAAAGDGGGGGGAAVAADDPNKLKVTEPGAEPRAVRKYTFVANKAEKRVLTMRQSASREGAGGQQDAPAFAITTEFVPKAVKPTGARFEMKVLGVDIPDAPAAQKAQVAAQLGAFKGLKGEFDLSKSGEIGEIDFKADERMQQSQAAEVVLQGLQQSLELIVPALPDAPIGVGAKWERNVERADRGMKSTNKHTFTLKEATAEGGVILAEIELTVPKAPVQQRGAPPGTTQEVKGKGQYTYAFKLNGISTKVDGEMAITQKIEVPDPKDPKGGKQVQSTVIKLKNSLDTAK